EERERRDHHAVERAGDRRGRAHDQDPGDGESGHGDGQTLEEPAHERVSTCEAHQLLVERSNRLDGPFVSAENREFWSAAQEVNELGGELAGRRGLSSTG